MKVREAIAALRRAVEEDTDCSFIGAGDGVIDVTRGRLALLVLAPLTREQVATLKQRVPEMRAFDSWTERLS